MKAIFAVFSIVVVGTAFSEVALAMKLGEIKTISGYISRPCDHTGIFSGEFQIYDSRPETVLGTPNVCTEVNALYAANHHQCINVVTKKVTVDRITFTSEMDGVLSISQCTPGSKAQREVDEQSEDDSEFTQAQVYCLGRSNQFPIYFHKHPKCDCGSRFGEVKCL